MKSNYRTQYKKLNEEGLIKKASHLSDMMLSVDTPSYFREFLYVVTLMNKKGIDHDYTHKGDKH